MSYTVSWRTSGCKCAGLETSVGENEGVFWRNDANKNPIFPAFPPFMEPLAAQHTYTRLLMQFHTTTTRWCQKPVNMQSLC